MRQLHVIPYYDPAVEFGGVRTVCRLLVNAMAARGHHVTVLTTDVASPRARLESLRERLGDVEVVRVRNLTQRLVPYHLYTPLGFAAAVSELLRCHDLVHVHDVFNWLTYRTLERAARLGVPSVLSTDGLLSFHPERGRARTRAWLYRLLGRRTMARAGRIHAVSLDEADWDGLGIARDKLHAIPNSVVYPPLSGDGARFRARHGLGARTVVLFLGQLLRMKGVELVRALAAERRDDADLCFVFVGYRPDQPRRAAPAWIAPNVLEVGFLAGQDLADAYAGASIYTLPSYYDVMPNTLLDALAHGVPVLASHQCLVPEVTGAGAGVLVEPTLPALAAGLDELLARRHEWPAMGAAGRALIAERFTLARVHDGYEALYRALCGVTASG